MLEVAKESVVTHIAFAEDARAVRLSAETPTTFSYGVIDTHLRDIATGKRSELPVVKTLDSESYCDCPSGDWVFARKGSGEELAGYHPTEGRSVVVRVEGYPSHLATTPDGRILLFGWCSRNQNGYASRGWSEAGAFGPGFSVVVDTAESRSGHRRTCCGLAPLSDNERFVTVNWSMLGHPRLAVRSVATGVSRDEVVIEARDQPTLAVARDGTLIAVVAARSVFVFDPAELARPRRIVKNEGRKHFTRVAFHPSGRYLAATGNDSTVKLYDTETWRLARTFTWNVGKLRSVCFSSDGTLAAAGSDSGKVIVWDVEL